MNKKLKIFLIILGYFVVFILTFIFMGGWDDLLLFISESYEALEEIIAKLIEKLGGIIP